MTFLKRLAPGNPLRIIPQLDINAQTGTTYTYLEKDAGQIVTHSNASAITATVPANSTTAFPIGTLIIAIQIGAGQVTFAAGVGVTLNSSTGNLTISTQNSVVILRKTGTNTWYLSGDLTVTSNVIARDATDLTVGNTTAKSTVWSVAVAANKLGLDKTIVFEISGEITIGNATNVITVTVEYGATTLYADATVGTTAVAGVPHPFFFRLLLSEHAGVTNSQVLGGHISMGTAAATTSGHGDLGAIIANGTGFTAPITGASAIDSTSSQNFVVSLTMSAGNNVANTWTRKNAIAYMLGEGQKGDTGPQGIAGTGTGTLPLSANSPQSGNYTAQLTDAQCLLEMNSGSAQNFTIPPNSSVAFPIGTIMAYAQAGAGAVTAVAGGGVTLKPTTVVSSRQDGIVFWIKTATDTWRATGDYA